MKSISYYKDIIKFDKYKNNYFFLIFFIILILLSFITIDTFYPKDIFVPGDDSPFHLKRFFSISQALQNGTYPFYIDSSALNGFGYATNLFYPDYFLLPFALLIPQLGVIISYKLLLFTFLIICGIVSYVSINKIFRIRILAVFFSLLYTFSLYHIIQFSYRNALGEFIAYSFIPMVFWGFYEIYHGDYRKKWFILCIAFSCVILSHLLSVLIIGTILVILLFISYKTWINQPKRFLYLVSSGFVCILITSCFIFPMLEQMSNNSFYYETNPFVENIANRAISIRQLITGMFKGIWMNYIYKSDIGITLIIPLIFRIFIRKKDRIIRIADLSMILGFLIMICTTDLFPWQIFPFNRLNILQFPWRLIGMSSFFLTFSCCVYVYFFVSYTRRSLTIKYTFLIIGLFIVIIINGRFFQKNRFEFIAEQNTDWFDYNMGGGNEYIPSTVPSIEYLQQRGNQTIETDENSGISNVLRKESKFYFDIKIDNTTDAILPLLYYKGYKVTLNGQDLNVSQSPDGLIQVEILHSGNVVVWFNGTLIQRISLIISLLTFIFFMGYIIYTGKKMFNQK